MKIEFHIWEDSCIVIEGIMKANNFDDLIKRIQDKNDDKLLNLKDTNGMIHAIKPSDINAIKLIF